MLGESADLCKGIPVHGHSYARYHRLPPGSLRLPAFQQAALDYCGLDVRFHVWETPPDRLPKMIDDLRATDVLGANVTVPHKEAVLPLLDRLADSARSVGAVNSIVSHDGELVGHNADGTGFLRALKKDGGFHPAGKRVLLLGAGGAARAVAHILTEERVASLTIANRSLERAQSIVDRLPAAATLEAVTLDAVAMVNEGEWDLIVNTTTLGMRHSPGKTESPLPSRAIPPHALVYDLVYNPQETPLLQKAKRAGARTLGGLPMLIYQGAEVFQLWTGREAPLEVMFQAAHQALDKMDSVH